MSQTARLIPDLRLAMEATVSAGELVKRDFGDHGDVRMKSASQPVTETDLRVDRSLRDRLLGERPDYGWLSEETRDDRARLERELVWVVDPVDGTSSFIAGYPDSVVSVGLAESASGRAMVGVVFNPLTGELYWAVRSGGAYGLLLQSSAEYAVEPPRDELYRVDGLDEIGPDGWGRFMIVHDVSAPAPEPPRVLVSRSVGEDEPDPPGWTRIQRGSTAYKMAGVAAGLAEAYYARGPKSEWDLCAASLIIEEAGGRVTDLGGEELRFNRPETERRGVVCGARPAIHARLMQWLRGNNSRGAEEESGT